jgi:hypothetical protein
MHDHGGQRGHRMSGRDKREAKRVPHLCEVECSGTTTRKLETRINDLSVTGAFVDSIVDFPVGTELRLKFTVGGTVVDVTAEVRYHMPGVGVGVEFVDLTPDEHAGIEAVVAQA